MRRPLRINAPVQNSQAARWLRMARRDFCCSFLFKTNRGREKWTNRSNGL
jgi:hypothetical protein